MKTALLVVDAQKVYTSPDSDLYCEDSKGTVGRINKLIEKFEGEGWPIVFIRHVHKADGSDLGRMFDYAGDEVEEFEFVEGTEAIEYDNALLRPKKAPGLTKNRYSAFIGTKLEQRLKKLGVGRVVVCGFMTNFCCESTARDAHDRDYFVDFVLDATGTPGTDTMDEPAARKTVGEFMEGGFSRVFSTEECLAQDYSS